MKVLVLAAGYATRLYPLTKDFPKPLLPIKGRPIIDYIIEKIGKIKDANEIMVITNSKFFPLFKSWAYKKSGPQRLRVIDDQTKQYEDRRGAIGDMYFAIQKMKIKEDLLVVGGDNLFDGQVKEFVSFARKKKKPVIGIFDIGKKSEATKYGVVTLDASRRLVGFSEKPKNPDSSLVAMCLYYFPKASLSLMREYYTLKSQKRDATGFYIDWLRTRETVYGFVFSGRWYDIGDHHFYREANKKF
jgi:glucose-1-phosphate thymidylyltransferase